MAPVALTEPLVCPEPGRPELAVQGEHPAREVLEVPQPRVSEPPGPLERGRQEERVAPAARVPVRLEEPVREAQVEEAERAAVERAAADCDD